MAKTAASKPADKPAGEVEEFVPPPRPELPSKDGRLHWATYAKDKMKGGYNVRIIGPQASKMRNRWVPVTRIDNTENMEFVRDIIWSGVDDDTKQPVALYSMWKAPKDPLDDEIPF